MPPPGKQLRDEAAALIREQIVSGHAAPGTLLRLGPLAEQVAVSTTPVREALLLLAQDGWVVQEPNRGFRVAPITRGDVDDSYLVQAFIAGELVARAASQPTEVAISELRRLDAEIAALTGKQVDQRADDLNHRLLATIFDLADSPRLLWFLHAASRFAPRRLSSVVPGWREHNRAGHGPLIDAVEARDSDRARELMVEHTRIAAEILLVHLDSVSFWDRGNAD